MAKEFAKKFYNSKAWKTCRQSYIAQRTLVDGGLCERCRSLPGYILHHKVKLNPQNIKDPYIALNHCNLEFMCKQCHDEEHYSDIHKFERVFFDENGQVIPQRE